MEERTKIDGEKGIVIAITPEAIEFRLPTIEWTMGSHGPASSSQLWKRAVAEDIQDSELEELIKRALRARRREFKRCQYCGELVPPEHRIEKDVCHGCASKHLGVVF
ncbi:hypothetical protein MYX84_03650 [Acidobacteria bacterium AH-259-O06]|nr:hypothetical protein [Acidobacteria bacterium AH-259-O06]